VNELGSICLDISSYPNISFGKFCRSPIWKGGNHKDKNGIKGKNLGSECYVHAHKREILTSPFVNRGGGLQRGGM
jgi:predicted heme/steroid binding protein